MIAVITITDTIIQFKIYCWSWVNKLYNTMSVKSWFVNLLYEKSSTNHRCTAVYMGVLRFLIQILKTFIAILLFVLTWIYLQTNPWTIAVCMILENIHRANMTVICLYLLIYIYWFYQITDSFDTYLDSKHRFDIVMVLISLYIDDQRYLSYLKKTVALSIH